MSKTEQLAMFLKSNRDVIGKVVDFHPATDRLCQVDLTANNPNLTAKIISNSDKFSAWVNSLLTANNCKYGIGGYFEHRTIYKGIPLFETQEGARLLHLGVDIWAGAGTVVYSPLAGKIHSFADNKNFGDYGPTIILKHELNGLKLFTLYGHLNRACLKGLSVGMGISKNQKLGEFGDINENGQWPPHLHFQLMFDMQGNQGDYPGACLFTEKEKFLLNIPDPQLLLNFPKAVNTL